jgi:hypothetical protein
VRWTRLRPSHQAVCAYAVRRLQRSLPSCPLRCIVCVNCLWSASDAHASVRCRHATILRFEPEVCWTSCALAARVAGAAASDKSQRLRLPMRAALSSRSRCTGPCMLRGLDPSIRASWRSTCSNLACGTSSPAHIWLWRRPQEPLSSVSSSRRSSTASTIHARRVFLRA